MRRPCDHAFVADFVEKLSSAASPDYTSVSMPDKTQYPVSKPCQNGSCGLHQHDMPFVDIRSSQSFDVLAKNSLQSGMIKEASINDAQTRSLALSERHA
jgi:hypothetical protein